MRRWIPLLAICLGTFMLLVDVTIVTVALPSMAKDLNTSLPSLEWVLDTYALTLAALLLGVGSLSDKLGRRRVFTSALLVFTLASLGCAAAPNIQVLIISRAVQGIGAAGLFGATMALLGMHYRGKERTIAFSAWGATNAVAAAAGPVLGGVLTEYLSWRWIFLVNLPVGIVTLVLSVGYLMEYRAPARARGDYLGVVLLTISMAALTFALIRANNDGWTSPTIIGLFVLAAASLAAFIAVELRHPDPLLDLRLFRRPSFSGLMAMGLLVSMAAFAYLPFTSLWMQSVLDYSAVKAGLYILPLSITGFLFAALVGKFGFPPRPTLIIGMLLTGIGAAAQAFLNQSSTGGGIIAGLLITGAGVGLITPALSSSVLSAAPKERGGMAGGAMNTFRQLGFALGVAIFGSVLQGRVTDAMIANGQIPTPAAIGAALSAGAKQAILQRTPADVRTQVDDLVHAAFAAALDRVMVIAAIFAAVGVVMGYILVRDVRNEEYAADDLTLTRS